MSSIPYVHHRRHYTIPNLPEDLQQESLQKESDLFEAESASEIMSTFYGTIVNGTPNIDANWIASHPAGLRQPKNSEQVGMGAKNELGEPFSPAFTVTKLV